MGMGDTPQAYRPDHKPVVCAVTRLRFAGCMMRPCPHPTVQQRYGKGCNVSVYVCKKCRHGERHPLFDGYACTYSKTM